MGCVIPERLCVYTDNNQAISFAGSTCVNSRLRGIFSRHWGFVKELKDAGEMELKHVAGIN